ncbi:hypothetical protein IBX38_08220 [Candidatus Bathyarchaeota archaeon]|nr:hypothetical protein [Candidatus Bathyarchaeota archaeon]
MMESFFTRTSVPLGKNELAKIRARAMRRGVWFRVLTRGERAQVDLTMRVVKRIRSFILAKVITSIVEKLLDAMESRVARLMREVGQPLAQKLSGIAQEWGNRLARQWMADPGFVQYLTVNYMNTPTSFPV